MNIIKIITKRIRCNKVKVFIKDKSNKKLLDIGCGDGFFIKGFKNINVNGIDKIYGQNVEIGLDYKNDYFDYVTMLAVIEHLTNYKKVISECHRIIEKDGLLILTTPLRKAEKFMKLYFYSDLEHKQYFTKKDFENLKGFKLIHYSTFEFGLNQLIVLMKT